MRTIDLERLTRLTSGEYARAPRAAILDRFFRDRETIGEIDIPAGSLRLRFQNTEPRRGDLYRMGGQTYSVHSTEPEPPFFQTRLAVLTPYSAPVTLSEVGHEIVADWGGALVAAFADDVVANWQGAAQ